MINPLNTEPAVSVIIPVYNRYGLLKEAVSSVLNQTFTDYELLVMDDGSTDRTADISALPNVMYHRLEHCGMAGRVRNQGAAMARGRYIAFLDSDDLWEPEKLARQVDFMKRRNHIKICHTREVWLRQDKIISQRKQRHKREGDIFNDALEKCIIGPSTVMIDRVFYLQTGGFREDLEIAEDYELWLRMTDQTEVGYLEEPLTIKRAGSWDQLSEKYGQIEIFRINALKDLVEKNLLSEKNYPAAKKELARKAGIYSIGCRKRGKEKEAEIYSDLASLYSEV